MKAWNFCLGQGKSVSDSCAQPMEGLRAAGMAGTQVEEAGVDRSSEPGPPSPGRASLPLSHCAPQSPSAVCRMTCSVDRSPVSSLKLWFWSVRQHEGDAQAQGHEEAPRALTRAS